MIIDLAEKDNKYAEHFSKTILDMKTPCHVAVVNSPSDFKWAYFCVKRGGRAGLPPKNKDLISKFADFCKKEKEKEKQG